ncbi:hypothetical protein GCM10008171_08460 [Methylopila jiangsuensis]|uniref:Endolytic peptidoglycan transglycosylase RlpA n=1 Tax=Methylopila jiangsuensis TaxID=586230 RepID=A0A9W6JEM2_9HYPH|nr:septal ring lytic transglycosylase RlpA family protein [Methylopila jiangsuensis]MDR6285834.1 rare lipoprotein A [Methylopila jiangsuensis]GLK75592.1 hypothetical protein GCM10008171_08460 [Methylopila jiangsuensis]
MTVAGALSACSAQTARTPVAQAVPAAAASEAVKTASAAPAPRAAPTRLAVVPGRRTPGVIASSKTASPRTVGVGLASWYGGKFHGRRTANGEIYDKTALTAAHPSLPLPSYVRVTNVSNGRSLVVRVNDRGPFHKGRVIDVSARAADMLGFRSSGVGAVKLDYVGPADPNGSDERKLLASYRDPGVPAGGVQVASLTAPAPSDAAFAGAPAAPTPRVATVIPPAAPVAAATVSAYAAQPKLATAAPRPRPAGVQAAPAPKRVIAPSEPVLASVAPPLATPAETGAPEPVAAAPESVHQVDGAAVASRIASSFEGFGDAGAMDGLRGSASAFSTLR